MSTAPKKPPAGTTSGRRAPGDTVVGARTTPPPSTATNGIGRTRSLRGSPLPARTVQRAGTSNLSTSSMAPSSADDDARAEMVALIDDLKERLRKSETESEHFQKQAQVLQLRLDETLAEQGKWEDRLHETDEKLETLKNEQRESQKQKREMEAIYEAERSSMLKDREEMGNREEEMQVIIQRLKDSLSQKSSADDESRISRRSNNSSPSIDGQFAPSSGLNRSDSKNNSKLLLQKDRLIESLRLELAEAQIKLVESENMGGGRLQEVERLLLEARMTNARIMEDNESYQLLLSQKTLAGDFTHSDFMGSVAHADTLNALEGRSMGTSLADELSDAAEGESENYRRLESELKSQKDQNKALTLYINKIIERLLQHQDFEAILDQSIDAPPIANIHKDLPPPPPPKEASGATVLQRARSVAMRTGRPTRPQSHMPAANSALTDPDTAPSIPFGLSRSTSVRSRPRSEQYTGGAASVVNQMYRGNNGQISPPLQGPQTPRHSQSFFAPPAVGGNPNAAHRVPSSGQVSGNFPGMRSDTSSISGDSGDVNTPPSVSPPRNHEKTTTFAGNKPRPLRLVQDRSKAGTAEDVANKRASWMGWFGGKTDVAVNGAGIPE